MKRLLILLLLAGSPFAADASCAETGPLDPARVGWTQIELRATKLFMSARARMRLANRSAAEMYGRLQQPGEGDPVPMGERALELSINSDAFGQRSDVDLFLDPRTGAAIQRVSVDSGKRQRHRVYRFTDVGAYQRSRSPADGEDELPHEQWSDRSEDLYAYPRNTGGVTVTESTGLIYVAAAAPLRRPGDRMQMLTYARRHLHLVTLEVVEAQPAKIKYEKTISGQRVGAEFSGLPVRILIRGYTVDNNVDEQFDMFGLRGDIELLLEPETRLPLQLSGKVKIAGAVGFRLHAATLTTPAENGGQ